MLEDYEDETIPVECWPVPSEYLVNPRWTASLYLSPDEEYREPVEPSYPLV